MVEPTTKMGFLIILLKIHAYLRGSMGHLAPEFDLHWFHGFFFKCLIFELFSFTNVDVVTLKTRHLKKIRETDASQIKMQDVPQCFHEFFSMSNL